MDLTWLALAVGVLAMLVVAYLAWSISKEPAGTPQMDKIAGYIQEGANAFIKRQYKTITIFVALTLVPLTIFFKDVRVAIAFVFGASLFLASCLHRLARCRESQRENSQRCKNLLNKSIHARL